MSKLDFAVDKDNELRIINGDFKISSQDLNQAKTIIDYDKGFFRQFPTLGFGLQNYIGTSISNGILVNGMIAELAKDNFSVERISISQNGNEFNYVIQLG